MLDSSGEAQVIIIIIIILGKDISIFVKQGQSLLQHLVCSFIPPALTG